MGFSSAMLRQLEGLRERCGPTPWSSPWGLDAFEGDPFGGLSVFTLGFARMAEAISGVGLADACRRWSFRKGLPLPMLSANVAPRN